MSVNAVPKTRSQAQHLKFPLGCVVNPLSGDPENVPVVNFGSSGVIRCKKCRTYINPFVTFVDGGSRWKCNVCSFLVETPNAYFAPLDAEGKRQDLQNRPELLKGEVEIIAPAEYMVCVCIVPTSRFDLSQSQPNNRYDHHKLRRISL